MMRAGVHFFPITLFLFLCNAYAHDGLHGPSSTPTQGKQAQIASLEEDLTQHPNDAFRMSRLGQLHLEHARITGKHVDFDRAIHWFNRVIGTLPSNRESWIGLAYAHLGRHDFDQAQSAARAVSEIAPEDPRVWALLFDVSIAMGHQFEANMLAQKMREESPGIPAIIRSAQISESMGDYNQAEAFYKKARQLSKDSQEQAWINTMMAEIYIQTNRRALAEKHFKKALVQPNTARYAHFRLAVINRYAGHKQRALHHIQHAITASPERPNVIFERGRIAQLLGDKKTTTRCFQRARAIIENEVANGDEGHLRELATFFADQNLDLDLALQFAQRDALKRQDWESRELEAWLLFRNGKVDEAAVRIGEALRTGSRHPRLLLRAGIIYDAADRTFQAYHAFDRGIEMKRMVDPVLSNEASTRWEKLKDNPLRIRQALGAQTKAVSNSKNRHRK